MSFYVWLKKGNILISFSILFVNFFFYCSMTIIVSHVIQGDSRVRDQTPKK